LLKIQATFRNFFRITFGEGLILYCAMSARGVERQVVKLSRCRLLDNSKVRVVNNSTSRLLDDPQNSISATQRRRQSTGTVEPW